MNHSFISPHLCLSRCFACSWLHLVPSMKCPLFSIFLRWVFRVFLHNLSDGSQLLLGLELEKKALSWLNCHGTKDIFHLSSVMVSTKQRFLTDWRVRLTGDVGWVTIDLLLLCPTKFRQKIFGLSSRWLFDRFKLDRVERGLLHFLLLRVAKDGWARTDKRLCDSGAVGDAISPSPHNFVQVVDLVDVLFPFHVSQKY